MNRLHNQLCSVVGCLKHYGSGGVIQGRRVTRMVSGVAVLWKHLIQGISILNNYEHHALYRSKVAGNFKVCRQMCGEMYRQTNSETVSSRSFNWVTYKRFVYINNGVIFWLVSWLLLKVCGGNGMKKTLMSSRCIVTSYKAAVRSLKRVTCPWICVCVETVFILLQWWP